LFCVKQGRAVSRLTNMYCERCEDQHSFQKTLGLLLVMYCSTVDWSQMTDSIQYLPSFHIFAERYSSDQIACWLPSWHCT